MTVIIAIEHPETGELAIAADGRTMRSMKIASDATQKLVVMDRAVFGVCGEHLFVNVLSHRFATQPYTGIVDFTERCRRVIEDAGIKPKDHEDGGSATFETELVVAADDGVWWVAADLSYTQVEPGRPCSCGSGGPEAAGAALAMTEASTDWEPGLVVRRAVEIAARLNTGCGGEVRSVTVPSKRTLKKAV